MSNRTRSFKERRLQKQAQEKRQRLLPTVLLLGVLAVAVAAAALLLRGGAAVTLTHIHGLGFSPDGEQLVVPAHDGLRVYADGEWFEPDVPERDYMGFTPVDEGFYSSGHPGPGDTLPNPLGLVKSADMGETLERLAFLGESDFHLMGVGYENHAVYVINSAANSQLQPGLHYSLDDGETWQQAAAKGITARPFGLAVHPAEANVLALGTEAGLFLSDDFGDSFAPVGDAAPVTSATFSPDGGTLFFGMNQLFSYDLNTEQIEELPTPSIAGDDAIGYIAISPLREGEIALATLSRDIYLSDDFGENWRQIAEDGKGR